MREGKIYATVYINYKECFYQENNQSDGSSEDYFVNGTYLGIPVIGLFDQENLESVSPIAKQYG